MTKLKRVLSIALCISILICFSAFADEPVLPEPPSAQTANVTVTVAENAIIGDTNVLLDVNIKDLPDTVLSGIVTVLISSDIVTINNNTLKADTEYEYDLNVSPESATTEDYAVNFTMTVDNKELTISPRAVTITLKSAKLLNESNEEIPVSLGNAATINISNPPPEVINASLTFNSPVGSTNDFTVTYQLVSQSETPAEEIPTVLELKNKGNTIKITTEQPLIEGTYKVNITAAGYIIPTVPDFVIDSTKTEPVFTANLIAGDINKDGAVDFLDFHKMCYAVSNGFKIANDSSYSIYDINRDGNIDKNDITLLVTNWSVAYKD